MTTFVIANFINPCNYITNDDSTHYICTQIEQNLDCHILIIWKKDHADAGTFARSSVNKREQACFQEMRCN